MSYKWQPKPVAFRSEANVAAFWKKVHKAPDGCWLWTGAQGGKGYGRAWTGVGGYRAHRVSLALAGVEMPPGTVVDHMCKVRTCINPTHLRVVTQRVNNNESESPTGAHSRKTHCKHGHEFTPENTIRNGPNGRACRQCKRTQWQRRYRRLHPQESE